ncbi:MAG: nucleotide disphospho-sugar-binding domain-containing protein [Acidimicrobiales bacterium]
MTHVVLVVNRLPSLLNTSLGASKRLRAAGIQTTFVCTENLAEPITAEGEQVVVLHHDELFAERVAADPRPPLGNPAAVIAWVRRRRQVRAESLASVELVEIITSLAPDLLLINAETHTAMIATETLGIPRLATTNFFSIFRGPDLPPLSMTMPSPTNPTERIKVRAAWWWVRGAAIYGRLRHRCSPAGLATLVSPIRSDTVDLLDLKQLAKALGVDLGARTDRSQWLRPQVYRDVPLLSYTAAEMDLPHRVAEQLSYVGPMVSTDRVEQELAAEANSRWQEMVAQRRAEEDSAPIVYCSLGTVWSTDHGFLQRVLEVFDRRRDWNLVLTLGSPTPNSDSTPASDRQSKLGTVSPNVLILDWAPQLKILANADCFITHGGVKSLTEAVLLGVPVVTYSTGFVDQNGNARRVQQHRLGLMGNKDGDTPADIEAAVEQAMFDPAIGKGIAEMRTHFQNYEAAPVGRGDGALVDLINRYISRTQNHDES